MQEAAELMKQGYKYLDVRSVPEFEAGHPEGALNIPLLHAQGGRMVANPDFQAVVQGNLAQGRQAAGGLQDGRPLRPGRRHPGGAGYTNVSNVRGGYSGERDMYGKVTRPGWADPACPPPPPPPRRHLRRAERQEGLALEPSHRAKATGRATTVTRSDPAPPAATAD